MHQSSCPSIPPARGTDHRNGMNSIALFVEKGNIDRHAENPKI